MQRYLLPAMLALAGLITPSPAADSPAGDRAAWFTEARLGGFIHWQVAWLYFYPNP